MDTVREKILMPASIQIYIAIKLTKILSYNTTKNVALIFIMNQVKEGDQA